MPAETTTAPRSAEADPRWAAIVARDAAADGRFVTAVLSTGIYCRPSCPARRPKPENVRFYATAAEAERAGFHPCKRCRPDGEAPAATQSRLVEAACREIESAAESPDLATLAAHAGLSPHHFHRLFKAATGVTPKGYADAARARRVQAALERPETSVTEAIFEAGFGSSGRFYAASGGTLGMTPTRYRKGGAGTTIRVAVRPCALGLVLVAASSAGVCAILLGDDAEALRADLDRRFPQAETISDDPGFVDVVEAVLRLVDAPGSGLDLPLDIAGTAFQRRVWEALRAIPAGETATYAGIAEAIGAPRAVRAVAQACAANPVAVAVPCHRVLRSDGDLSGYRWGIERKAALLTRERKAARGSRG